MKKIFCLVIIAFLSTLAYGVDYNSIDEYSRSVPKMPNYGQMSLKLTSPFKNDEDKVRSIFVWIAENIRYDVAKFNAQFKNGGYTRIYGKNHKEIELKKEKLKQDKINTTYNSEKGVCEDYCYLFQAMCQVSGIKCEFITGYGRQFPNALIRKTNSMMHAWNAVFINNEWKLVDVTWAAGITDIKTGKFRKKFQNAFFFTEPEIFILNHYPNENKWQLLERKISTDTYNNFPFVYDGYYDYSLKNIPKNKFLKSSQPFNILTFKFSGNIPALAVFENGNLLKTDKIVNKDEVTFKIPTSNKHNRQIIIGVLNGKIFDPIAEYLIN